MRARCLVARLGLGLLVLSTATSAVGWYDATRPRGGHQHFDACHELPDGTLVLDYTFGAGDKVTASVEPTASAFVASLHLEQVAGPRPCDRPARAVAIRLVRGSTGATGET
jgi:hypothetical protein